MVGLLPFLVLSFSWLASALTYHGADISSLTVVENSGIRYSDGGSVAPFETILHNHGMNAARVRVWTAGQYKLNYALALGKRIKAAGMTLIVDLHYSDTCEYFSYPFLYTAFRRLTIISFDQGPTQVINPFLPGGQPHWMG